jgi:hypothetical protein
MMGMSISLQDIGHEKFISCAGFTSKKYPSECRLEASNFIRLLCHTSVLTLQMFISCVLTLLLCVHGLIA